MALNKRRIRRIMDESQMVDEEDILEEERILDEASIRPGMALKRSNAKWRPDQGNVLILAGGAGSGKGFVLDNIIEFEGKKFDVDELKRLLRRLPVDSKWDKMFFDLYGKHLSDTDLSNPEDVGVLHNFCNKQLKLDKEHMKMFFKRLEKSSDRPNIIFDVTLKDMDKLKEIVENVVKVGYDKKCIHIIWVLNEHQVAVKQNSERKRKVPREILDITHVGASETLNQILKNGSGIVGNSDSGLVDGDIWVFFNKSGTDNIVRKSGHKWVDRKGKEREGMSIEEINAIKVKAAGRPMPKYEDIMNLAVKTFDKNGNLVKDGGEESLEEKIMEYVPTPTKDIWKKPKQV